MKALKSTTYRFDFQTKHEKFANKLKSIRLKQSILQEDILQKDSYFTKEILDSIEKGRFEVRISKMIDYLKYIGLKVEFGTKFFKQTNRFYKISLFRKGNKYFVKKS